MKHTPGPWTVLSNTHHSDDKDPRPYVYSMSGPDPNWCLAKVEVADWLSKEEVEANARLIAAAPELLACCVEFVRKCDAGTARSVKSYAQMTAAILKATGGE